MPSLRARAMRGGLKGTLRLMRSRSGGPPSLDGPPEELEAYALQLREQLERMGERMSPGSRIRWHDLDDLGGVPGMWVEDEAAAGADRAVLHLHGGAYLMGSPRTHLGLGAALSRAARAPVVLPDYRLAPENPFPAALDDAVAAYHGLLDGHGLAPAQVAVAGDSAGGGLALALLVHLRDAGEPLPACYVGLSPWTDLAGTGPSLTELDGTDPWLSAAMVTPAARAYAGDAPLDHPLVSPLYADLTGLPPMLVHVGSHEILLDDARRLVERARAAGVDASLGVFEEMWHVFHAFPGLPETRRAIREIGAFVRRCTVPAPGRRAA